MSIMELVGQHGSRAKISVDNILITSTSSSGAPTKLVVTTINNGSSPSTNTSFDVVIQAQDNSNVPQNVSANTSIALTKTTGNGTLSGTLTGTINAGSNSVTISGVNYNTAESGVSITATRTSGDVLASGTSSAFTVLGAASQLVFVNVPVSGQQGINLSPFTVEARRVDNSVDLNYIGEITIAKASGTGNISGTLTKTGVSGVATFNDIQFDASGAYTISASASGLTDATSGPINILSTSLPQVEDFDFTAGELLTDNGWVAHSGAGTNPITVTNPGLTYTSYPSSGIGNAALLDNTGEDVQDYLELYPQGLFTIRSWLT